MAASIKAADIKDGAKEISAKDAKDAKELIDFAKLNPEQQEAMKERIIATYKNMKAQVSQIATKIGELDADRAEHALVIKTITPLDPNRRCFRLVGGVLVERTIKEVLPAVQKNLTAIDDVVTKLTAQLKKRQQETNDFQQQYNIRTVDPDQKEAAREIASAEDRNENKAQGGGVLVG